MSFFDNRPYCGKFEKFEGKVLHKGETAIDGSLDATKGQISLGFSKGESLKGNNFSEVQDSANASASNFGLFKGFYYFWPVYKFKLFFVVFNRCIN